MVLGDSSVLPRLLLTCSYCEQQYPEGCVHHCPIRMGEHQWAVALALTLGDEEEIARRKARVASGQPERDPFCCRCGAKTMHRCPLRPIGPQPLAVVDSAHNAQPPGVRKVKP